MVQETLLAAWRGFDELQGRASLRTWLYRIATNRCLNLLGSSARRPAKEVAPMPEPPPPRRRSRFSPARTSSSRTCPTPPLVRRRATRRGKRPHWRSSPVCNGCRRCSAPLLCCATSSASRLEDRVVYHTYSAYIRGLDALWACTSGSTARRAGATRQWCEEWVTSTRPSGCAAATSTTARERAERRGIASRIPAPRMGGAVEVRPVLEQSEPPRAAHPARS
jgi:Sigma-70 region 2